MRAYLGRLILLWYSADYSSRQRVKGKSYFISVCKTGEAKITEGFNLICRHVIHTVGPRYNVKYVTAAEGALYSSYRNVLQLCR